MNFAGLYSMFNRHSANCFKSNLQFKLQVATTLTIRGNMRLFNGQRKNEICVYDGYELLSYGGGRYDSPLSNYYHSRFQYKNNWFYSAQQAIQWKKAKLFCDGLAAVYILKHSPYTPSIATLYGGRVRGYDYRIWSENKQQILTDILMEKFSQNKHLKKWLLSNKDAVLAEIAQESPDGKKYHIDTEWGISLGESDKEIMQPHLWNNYGKNLLGNTLIKVRNMISTN